MREIFTPFNREKLDKKQGTARPMMRPLATFSFFIFLSYFFIFSLSSSLVPPRSSFLLVPPSYSFLLPPRSSFLLVPPSSSSLLPPHPSFFLIQHCLNHLESVKVYFSSILTKAIQTDQPTDRLTNGQGLL